MRKQKVLKLNDLSLIKIRVFDVINDDGFVKENWRGIRRIELRPIELPNAEMGIALLLNGERLGMWRVYEQQIGQLPPLLNEEDGTFAANRSPSSIYYVYGSDNKRYRWLYYRPLHNGQFQIGCAFRRSRPAIPKDRDHVFRLIATRMDGGAGSAVG